MNCCLNCCCCCCCCCPAHATAARLDAVVGNAATVDGGATGSFTNGPTIVDCGPLCCATARCAGSVVRLPQPTTTANATQSHARCGRAKRNSLIVASGASERRSLGSDAALWFDRSRLALRSLVDRAASAERRSPSSKAMSARMSSASECCGASESTRSRYARAKVLSPIVRACSAARMRGLGSEGIKSIALFHSVRDSSPRLVRPKSSASAARASPSFATC